MNAALSPRPACRACVGVFAVVEDVGHWGRVPTYARASSDRNAFTPWDQRRLILGAHTPTTTRKTGTVSKEAKINDHIQRL